MPTTAAPSLVTRRLGFDALGGFPDLFRRYVAGDAAALDFFARDFRSADDLSAAVADTAALDRDRGPRDQPNRDERIAHKVG